MARKSSTFYRLERPHKDGYTEVVEFHTVAGNGNTYFKAHEELSDGSLGWIGKEMKITK